MVGNVTFIVFQHLITKAMMRQSLLRIDDRICQICTPCLAAKACRVKAIFRPDAGEPPYLDLNRCYDCRLCLPACEYGAVMFYSDSSH